MFTVMSATQVGITIVFASGFYSGNFQEVTELVVGSISSNP